MVIEQDLVQPAVQTAKLINLDLNEADRVAANAEAADHLDALAALPTLSPAAANIVTMVTGMMPPVGSWGDTKLYQQEIAKALRA